MTWSPSPSPPRRTPARRGGGLLGGLLVGAGWLLLALAIVMLFTQTNGSSLPAVLGVAGAVCASVGVLVLSRAPWAMFGLFAAFLCGAGLFWAADAKEVATQGRPVTCEVMAVRQESRSGPTNSKGQRETETYYLHTMKCPIGTFTLDGGSRPRPVGAKIEMVYVPGGQPRWAGVEGSNLRFGMGATSVGALLTLLLSLLGWRSNRRRAATEQNHQQAAMQRLPSTPPPPSPYQQW